MRLETEEKPPVTIFKKIRFWTLNNREEIMLWANILTLVITIAHLLKPTFLK